MKKLTFVAAVLAASASFAELPSPMPQNTAKLIIRQAVAEAKAYTDAAIKGGGGGGGESADVTALSNEVATVKADVATLKTKVDAAPTAGDVAAVAETASEAKGASTANTEAIANLSTAINGKLDASTAASIYQPKGSYLQSETDPSVPAWAKAGSKPSYDASEITYQNGFVGAYLTELNGKIPSVPGWALAESKPTYDASEITYGNGFVGAYLAELNGKIPVVPAWALNSVKPSYSAAEITYGNGFVGDYLVELKGQVDAKASAEELTGLSTTVAGKANATDVYSKTQADQLFLTHHQDLGDYPKKSEVYSKTEMDATVQAIEDNLATKAGRSYAYSKAESDALIADLASKAREALARIAVLEKSTTPKEGVTGVVAASGQTVTVDDANTDAVVGGTVDTGVVTLTAKSVDIANLAATPQYGYNQAGVMVTSPKVDITDSEFAGPTQQSSNLMEVHNADTMTIKGVKFTGQTYNTIMTGQRTADYLSSLTIEDCDFAENCKHVNVWFGGFKDNAVLTIRNCHFATCEQFLCVSDFAGKTNKLTINLENVTVDNYEHADGDKYSGIILFDDRVCTNEADFLASKPFANVTLNISNLTVAGTRMNSENFKLGTDNGDQMVYVYCAKSAKTYPLNADNKALWPKVVLDSNVLTDPAN